MIDIMARWNNSICFFWFNFGLCERILVQLTKSNLLDGKPCGLLPQWPSGWPRGINMHAFC